jgi:tetratricopeptide (TPR) repeat protein
MIEHADEGKLPPISGPSSEESPDGPPTPLVEGYEIIGPLGRGGMGTVWRALQLSTRRHVALKVLERGAFGSQKALARFEREIELTARLQHPNIAQVFDSGQYNGTHYYAMELIEGVPLDQYVEGCCLARRGILELMRTVCEAVQHAHERGVIHRDLKPSNILVTPDGQPHVLDFGLAKAFQVKDWGLNVSTDGEPVGTPAYMSPEQAAGNVDHIDTRADVYSLSAILFLLLTGELPHDLSGTRYDVLRRIAEEEVKRPREITGEVDRELEALLLKALAHDPKDRYPSAGALAQDIENYLIGEPLAARPPTIAYFVRKRIKKYRIPVAVALSVLAILIGTGVFSYIRIARERSRAVKAEERAQRRATETEEARDNARKEADKAKAMYEFVESIIASVNPARTGGRQVTVREELDRAASEVGTTFAEQPEVEAAIRQTMGGMYMRLGEYSAAETQYSRALEIRHRIFGEDHPDTLTSLASMAFYFLEKGKYDQAEPMLRQCLKKQRRILGEEHPETLGSLQNLALIMGNKGRFDEEEALDRQALEISRCVRGKEHEDTLACLSNLASAVVERGKLDEGERMFRECVEVERRVLGSEHPLTLHSLSRLAETLQRKGELGEAEATIRKALETQRRVLGDEHPDTLSSMSEEGRILFQKGELDEAERLFSLCLEAQQRILGNEHPSTLTTMNSLGCVHREKGEVEEAESIFKKVLATGQRLKDENHPDAIKSKMCLACVLFDEGQIEEAKGLFRQGLEEQRRVLGDEHPDTLETMANLASALAREHELNESESLFREAVQRYSRTLGRGDRRTLQSTVHLAHVLMDKGSFDGAEQLLNGCLDVQLGDLEKSQARARTTTVPAQGQSEAAIDAQEEAKVFAHETFDGKLTLDWKILHAAPLRYSLSKNPGALTITTQEGDFYKSNTDYENLFLIDCPEGGREALELTTCITFRPVASWNQAGLIFYNDDDNYLKFVYEWEDATGGRIFTIGAETEGDFWTVKFRVRQEFDKVWLRVTKRANHYTFFTSLDGEEFIPKIFPAFDRTGRFDRGVIWGDALAKQVGIVATNGFGTGAPEREASFDLFDARGVPPDAGKSTEEARLPKSTRDQLAQTLSALCRLGTDLSDRRQFSRAEVLLRRCLEVQQCVLGAEHPHTLYTMNRLGIAVGELGKLDQAEEALSKCLEIRRRVLGQEHRDTLGTMLNLGATLGQSGKLPQAELMLRRCIEIQLRTLGGEHPDTLMAMRDLSVVLRARGKLDETETILRECLETCRRVPGEDLPDMLKAMRQLALVLEERGKHSEAEALNKERTEIEQRLLKKTNPEQPGS